METAIGVFVSRERAENAVRELLEKNIPQEAIVFLSRSETEARMIGKQLVAAGGVSGIVAGLSTGVAVVSLLMPGLGPVFALGLGVGAAAFLGLSEAKARPELGKTCAADSIQPTLDDKSAHDAAFFKDALRSGRSLIVVRSESPEVARVAGEVLDRTGIGLQKSAVVPTQTAIRQVNDIAILTVTGRITLGESSLVVRQAVQSLLEKKSTKILIDLHSVGYVDSSGIGELVSIYTSVRNVGGQVRIVNPSQRLHDLLQLTRLSTVFDVQPDEASAIRGFTENEPRAAP
jgi:anti-sigma B factor antagonist